MYDKPTNDVVLSELDAIERILSYRIQEVTRMTLDFNGRGVALKLVQVRDKVRQRMRELGHSGVF